MPASISVVIVTYNRGNLISFAIDSVLSQEFLDFELIIIDDSSTDNTEEIIKKYLFDDRIKYFKVEKCKSISQVRNAAWPHVSGKYVAILDSDDAWCDNLKLKKQYDFLEKNSKIVLVGSGAFIVNSYGKKIETIIKPEFDVEIKKDFFVKNPFFHSSVMYRAEIIKKIGGYDENIRFGEDLDLWLRLGKDWELYNIQEALIEYRTHNDNEANKHRLGAVVDVLKVIKKNRKIYNIGSIIFFKKIFNKLFEKFKFKNK